MKRITRYKVELVKDKTALYDVAEKRIKCPDDGYKIFEAVFELSRMTREHLVMLCLSTKNEVVGAHTVHIGAVNCSIVSARDVFQMALLNNASSIMIAHNHPSNDTHPSPEDFEVTKRLIDAGKIMGINLIDHLVIGEYGYTSIMGEYSHMLE